MIILAIMFALVALFVSRTFGARDPHWFREVGQRIDRGLVGTPMRGLGPVVERHARRVNVNPALVAAIAGPESTFGRYNRGSFNAFGWGPGIDFASWSDAFSTVSRGLRRMYLDRWHARNVFDIGRYYCPGCSSWPYRVVGAMGRFHLGTGIHYPWG